MTIKVTMTRQVTPGLAYELYELLVELRSRALKRPGYLSGETLVLASDPGFHMVISNWSSLREWRDWESHTERLEVIRRIDTLLTAPAKTQVWLERGESLSGV
ncbi:MAG: sugar biosynthesis protein [Chloroflexi bacterium]|nr:sugar biosynthesis protein [Chloroflexota bacterium]